MNNELQNYGFNKIENHSTNNAGMQIEQTRAAQEVQASVIMAKKFPRDENAAFQRIRRACTRPFLAEQAIYAYPRGNETVTGPSIRLAETIAQNWGNISFGIKEVSQENGVSLAKAYAWDLETNTIHEKEFHVPHKRYTKRGSYILTDPRDIYELVANNGARRLRACILGVIPGDIAEAAVEECKKTLSSGKEPLTDRVRKLVSAFSELGISIEHIEKRLNHKLEVIIEPEMVTLRAIYKSLKDGMAKREDFFDLKGDIVNVNETSNSGEQTKAESLAVLLEKNNIMENKNEHQKI